MGNRSNMFANIENRFEFADKETITATAINSLRHMFDEMEDEFEDNIKFGTMVLGAKLGVAGDGVINAQEKELINEVFSKVWNGSMDDIYNMLGSDIEDNEYNMVRKLTQLGNDIAMPFLYFVLSFAYIDGEIEDDVAERLDGLFGMNLLADFIQSGQEVVPAPKIRLTGLEADIVKWFQSDDQARPLNDIVAHFSGKSRGEVQKALDSLVDKGVLYGGSNIIGHIYGLA